jgi:hypothetical protein
VAAQQREIISSLTEDNPELSNLPENIDTLIQAEINAHADAILRILWPRRVQPRAPGPQ